MALIQLRILLYSPAGGHLCYFKFALSSTQTIYLLLYKYLFEECYIVATMGSAKIAKNEMPEGLDAKGEPMAPGQ